MFAAATASYYLVELPIRSGRMPWVGLSRRRLVLALPILVFAIVFATVRLTTITPPSLANQLTPLTPLACSHQQTAGRPLQLVSAADRATERPGGGLDR